MKVSHCRLLAFITPALLISGMARATNSVVQLNLEGSPTCSSLSTNAVLEAKDTSPPGVGNAETVTGPDGQKFTYRIGTQVTAGDTIGLWDVTHPQLGSGLVKPVNFVILKAQGNAGARVFHFGNEGAIGDTFETAPAAIATVSFCYGLAPLYVPPPPPPPAATLPPCDPMTLGDVCAADPTRLVTLFAESTPNWSIQTCSCGSTFTECYPELQAGTPGACTNGSGALQFLPVEVQLGRDPDSYYCTLIGGIRRCYRK